MDAFDREHHDNGEINEENDSSTSSSSASDVAAAVGNGSGEDLGRSSIRLTERLTDLFVGGGDGEERDLFVGRKDGGATTVQQWLQAMDMQMMGACRADERLKPMLKSNGAGGGSDDRLLAHLSQYFEPSEVGLLAMCLCIPLVSMRVGKVLKQGSLLCPTAVRGDLNLVLLPTSDLRLSFVGDDGQSERLFTMGCNSESSAAVIEELPADSSGRSFLVKSPDSDIYYFWCSEKSKLLGIELLAKMKDLLKTKPSLSELTGIRHSRLDCFATHLRAYFSGSASCSTKRSSSSQCLVSLDELGLNTGAEFTTLSSKPLRRNSANQVMKSSSLCQTSLSPRPNLFKEEMSKNLSSLKNVFREKLRRRGGDVSLSVLDNFTVSSSNSLQTTYSDPCTQQIHLEVSGFLELPTCSLMESFERAPSSFCSSSTNCSTESAICSPAYCWCPVESCLTGSLQLPSATTILQTLPPLSSLLPASRSSSWLTPSTSSLHLVSGPIRELPSFLPDSSSIRFPFTMPSSQQIPTFTPFICEPIVHIPVIDVCSSGQGYLVSAGLGISTTLPPLHSTFVNQMMPQNDVVENGARETLRLLISNSEQSSAPLLDMFSKCDDSMPGILAGGSRGLYSGTCDVDVIANSIAALGMITLSDRSIEVGGYTSRELLPGNHELETSDLDEPYNETNSSSLDENGLE